ncbi:hemagglutinin repeat-containing protein, partial [Achromobacter insolitus]|uniref:hemagglutinin repeat-containing protein n=1 Tax=Achromobacter insolitus TaxID=217204 RepID=UPI000AF07EAA
KQADDAKSSRLAAVKVGQAAYQAVQANRMLEAAEGTNATAADKENASAQIQISVGASKSVSETKRTQESVFGSSVMGGGNVSIVTLGERGVPGSGDLSIIGSDVTGKNVLLGATNDLSLLSQAQSSTETSTNKNSGWKVGVG